MRLHLAFLMLAAGLLAGNGVSGAQGAETALPHLKYTHTVSQLPGLWHAYAPSVMKMPDGSRRMWLGGWLTEGERVDAIFYSDLPQGAQTWTQPVKAFDLPGELVNDPSVIRHPHHHDWLFMYFTMLNSAHAAGDAMVHHNHVGFASSIDGGKTWTYRGEVIGQDNGYNRHGAWAPSALLSQDRRHIYLYYHTNSPSVMTLRTVFDLNGWQQVGRTQPVTFLDVEGRREAVQSGRINVDVAQFNGGQFAMAANDNSLFNIGLYRAGADGLTFRRERVRINPIVQGGPNQVLTPHIEPVDGRNFILYFGFGRPDNACARQWQAAGITDMRCSDSVHGWNMRYFNP